MRVLIIEDDRSLASALTEVLALGGCESEMEFDGLAGLRHLETLPLPDLVMLDLAMPVMGGRELLERLVADPRLRVLPVVVMTATRRADLLPPSGSYRALLHKPFEIEEVLRLVAELRPAPRGSA
jgi:CheY-like chemotaxis protein